MYGLMVQESILNLFYTWKTQVRNPKAQMVLPFFFFFFLSGWADGLGFWVSPLNDPIFFFFLTGSGLG
jgi:hypothetical protein